MFRSLSKLAAAGANTTEASKAMSPTLRADIYTAIDQTKLWIIGGVGGGQAGDGVSFGSIVSTIQKHFPETTMGLESMAQVESETAIVVGGITNMILEMSKWDGMAGGMAMRTWVEALSEAYTRVAKTAPGGRKDQIANGITRGVNQNTDVTLMTREFAARIQIISTLKTGMWLLFQSCSEQNPSPFIDCVVNTRIYGVGSDQARQGEALWSSKFI